MAEEKQKHSPADGDRQEYLQVDVVPPCCPKCGSTNRGPFHNCRTLEINGVHQGHEYNQVRWRRSQCIDCGQRTVYRFFEMVLSDPRTTE